MNSERRFYQLAVQAAKADPALPEGATLGRRSKAQFYVAKNAACVHIPYQYPGDSGDAAEGLYVVWFKRIAIRWEVDRSGPLST